MKRTAVFIFLLLVGFAAGYAVALLRGPSYPPPASPPPDPFELSVYKDANVGLTPPVVFFGDSIIYRWDLEMYFPTKGYVNRGIGGQTTAELLGRFYNASDISATLSCERRKHLDVDLFLKLAS
jgi:hypothetical protein